MAKKGNIPWNKGKKWSNKVKKKISKSNTGKKQKTGIESAHWIGNKVKYHSMHLWIRRVWGQPQYCEFCRINNAPKNKGRKRDYFNWSMKHGTYSRERTDWIRLCRSCHCKYDKLVNNFYK